MRDQDGFCLEGRDGDGRSGGLVVSVERIGCSQRLGDGGLPARLMPESLLRGLGGGIMIVEER